MKSKYECHWLASHPSLVLINHKSNEIPKFTSQSEEGMDYNQAQLLEKSIHLPFLNFRTNLNTLVTLTFLKEIRHFFKRAYQSGGKDTSELSLFACLLDLYPAHPAVAGSGSGE